MKIEELREALVKAILSNGSIYCNESTYSEIKELLGMPEKEIIYEEAELPSFTSDILTTRSVKIKIDRHIQSGLHVI